MGIKHHEQVTLGQLIELLSKRDHSRLVYFDFCYAAPTADVDSYRGFYEDLAIGFSMDSTGVTAGKLVEVLSWAVGRTFDGYKGGQYTMDRHSAVWVANYGRSSQTAIAGLCDDEHSTVIRTVNAP